MKTLTSLIVFFLFTSMLYSQNTEVNKDEHTKTQKEINKLLESPSNDTLLKENNTDMEIPEKESISKETLQVPAVAPSPQKGIVNLKSEPVPGAEIITDEIPTKKEQKNKTKSTLKNNQTNSENNNTKNNNIPKQE